MIQLLLKERGVYFHSRTSRVALLAVTFLLLGLSLPLWFFSMKAEKNVEKKTRKLVICFGDSLTAGNSPGYVQEEV